MPATKSPFTEEEEFQIVEAIRKAENRTSGEIRVHIGQTAYEEDALERAQKIFLQMRMINTVYRNAVLIHICLESKKFGIFGDEGINNMVADDFWDSTKNVMQSYFVQNQMAKGICEGVKSVGEQLKTYFPFGENDNNELANDIVYD